jgi:spheroidene monooxygenase
MTAPDPTILLVLVRWQPASRLWGMMRLPLAAVQPLQAPGLLFYKVLGSGRHGGFGLVPSLSHQGLFTAFDHETQARAFLEKSPVLDRYRQHAAEFAWLLLKPSSVRGSWSGFSPGISEQRSEQKGPVASLTRASIRPRKLRAFWSQSPAAEADLTQAEGCRLAVGLGEAPLLRQATFSLWDSLDHMNAYARSGAHLRAIQTAYRDEHFSESMFVRFSVQSAGGEWKGMSLGGQAL